MLLTIDNYLAEVGSNRDKIIMEDVANAEQVYKILEALLKAQKRFLSLC